MACVNNCNKKVAESQSVDVQTHEQTNCNNDRSSLMIVLVLYILLAIIVGSYII